MTNAMTNNPPPPPPRKKAMTVVPQPPLDIAIAQGVSATLTRRGYLTTEWWTTVIGAAISSVLALVGVHGSVAAQVTAIAAPVLLAATYAVVRSSQKSELSQLLATAVPQAGQPV